MPNFWWHDLSILSVSKPKYYNLFNCKLFKFVLYLHSVIMSNWIIKYIFANKETEAKVLTIQDTH